VPDYGRVHKIETRRGVHADGSGRLPTLRKMPYSSDGKNSQQVLKDFEAGLLNDHGGNTTEYLHAVIMVRTAQEQRRWATVAAIAACLSLVVAIVALVIAAHP
jgi:hypothetical protein